MFQKPVPFPDSFFCLSLSISCYGSEVSSQLLPQRHACLPAAMCPFMMVTIPKSPGTVSPIDFLL